MNVSLKDLTSVKLSVTALDFIFILRRVILKWNFSYDAELELKSILKIVLASSFLDKKGLLFA